MFHNVYYCLLRRHDSDVRPSYVEPYLYYVLNYVTHFNTIIFFKCPDDGCYVDVVIMVLTRMSLRMVGQWRGMDVL